MQLTNQWRNRTMFDGKNKIPTTKEEEMKAKYAAWQWMQIKAMEE